jgi:D-alanine-D-alanine ligase
LFIKPANGGSSVGIAKVQSNVELEAALLAAHKFDDKVLIERAIQARELEVAVLGNGLDARASGVGEIIRDRDFYDYESKYDSNSQTRVDIPAKISDELSTRVTDIATKVYRALDCRGMARVDFFLDEGDELYVNEVNTLPGFTDISMYPKLFEASGITKEKLLDILIELAFARYEREKSLKTNF